MPIFDLTDDPKNLIVKAESKAKYRRRYAAKESYIVVPGAVHTVVTESSDASIFPRL
ncbi:predicted protein [Sclerotinia sclerotiorum 1980 UF-70]|uniref:Uncharacterized protein n=1 Tax=Sclerotinia sclerotiorum (strain ATCC 18683 / 1980 / Ss-1) TaxID=665079 RepID=A7F764_SCLS1|nr:predicted protein [Sclerotinia sclerotiorum 1980 UF-70]EDN98585.1 predicted protein [Sclerotinia sclerotiorum 1980 UF-70]